MLTLLEGHNPFVVQASRGPGSYSAPSMAPGLSRPSPAFQDKQDRFERPLQSMVPPVHTPTPLCLWPPPLTLGPKLQGPCPLPLPYSPQRTILTLAFFLLQLLAYVKQW